MLGCDLHCAYCQNWFTSQSLRDPEAVGAAARHRAPRARRLALRERRADGRLDVQRAAHHVRVGGRGLPGGAASAASAPAYVSNGNGTPQVLDYIRPWVDFYKVDLKSMDDKHYRQLGGVLQNVLDTIAGIHERGIWLEVVTLVDPRLQRLGGGADARRRLPRLGLAGHSRGT